MLLGSGRFKIAGCTVLVGAVAQRVLESAPAAPKEAFKFTGSVVARWFAIPVFMCLVLKNGTNIKSWARYSKLAAVTSVGLGIIAVPVGIASVGDYKYNKHAEIVGLVAATAGILAFTAFHVSCLSALGACFLSIFEDVRAGRLLD